MWNLLRSKQLDQDYMWLLSPPVFLAEKMNLLQYILTLRQLFTKAQELVYIYLAPLELERQQQSEKSLPS
jgi:hypothetical protein